MQVRRPSSVGRRIRALRTQKGLSLKVVADFAGISESHLSRIESGHRPVDKLSLVDALAGALHTTRDYLIGHDPEPSASASPPERCELILDETGTNHAAPDIVMIRSMLQGFQAADRQVGGAHLYPSVIRFLRDEVSPRLLTGTSGAALFGAAASVTEIAGWMAHDGGDDETARGHLNHAYRLAMAAQNDAMIANVCASLAHLANHSADPRGAIRFAETGLQHAHRAQGVRHLVARLHAMKARGLARLLEPRDCYRSLDDAESLLLRGGSDVVADWIAPFDMGSLAGEAAACMHALGQQAEAERQAQRVIELRPIDRLRARAFGQLTLANALIAARRIDEAADIGATLCGVMPQLTSARVRIKVGQLGDALAPFRATKEVTAFLEQLRAIEVQDPRNSGWLA